MIPLFKFKIEGNSMYPAFKSGDVVLVNRLSYFLNKPKINDIIILKKEKYIIKRITKIDGNRFFVEGDNVKESTDSRNFGWVPRKAILGKVIYRLSA